MNENRRFFLSADEFPVKLAFNSELIKHIRSHRRIPPYHVQFNPTNRCNLKCAFCSCSERDKTKELDTKQCFDIIVTLAELGCRSVTISGGGEPLMHPHIEDVFTMFSEAMIEIGFVTNGPLLKTVSPRTLNLARWCRISNSDDRDFSDAYAEMLSGVVRGSPLVDWAFSHVVTENPNIVDIGRLIDFANRHNFSHVRLVGDLLNPGAIDWQPIRDYLRDKGIDTRLVIFQERKIPEHGGPCYICFVKPVIAADGKVHSCCGAQYALETPTRDFPEELCLGDVSGLKKIYEGSNVPLDGSVCARCYYMSYNRLLASMMKPLKHIYHI